MGVQACCFQQRYLELLLEKNLQEILNKLCFVREVRTPGYQEVPSTFITKFTSDFAGGSDISSASFWSLLCITGLPHRLVHLVFIKLLYALTT